MFRALRIYSGENIVTVTGINVIKSIRKLDQSLRAAQHIVQIW